MITCVEGIIFLLRMPMNAVNSRFYQYIIRKIASVSHGYEGPSYHALRVGLLCDAKLQVSLIIDSFRSTWTDTGCTLMCDGWKDTRQRALINFWSSVLRGILSFHQASICFQNIYKCRKFM